MDYLEIIHKKEWLNECKCLFTTLRMEDLEKFSLHSVCTMGRSKPIDSTQGQWKPLVAMHTKVKTTTEESLRFSNFKNLLWFFLIFLNVCLFFKFTPAFRSGVCVILVYCQYTLY